MKQYVVDAFTDHVFAGNPAALCVMETFPEDHLLQQIAVENNLSETAYLVPHKEGYDLRWFTPGGEIDLCGHATLASAFLVFTKLHPEWEEVPFYTRSGVLTVAREKEEMVMEFPAYHLKEVPVTEAMAAAIGVRPGAAFMGRDLLCVLPDEEDVRCAAPDLALVKALPGELLHITARGKEYDCVSRSFAPKLSVDEDPVCGSGHCHIFPYWAKVLHKERLSGYQASRRGGEIGGVVQGDTVFLSGKAVLFSEAELYL